MKADLVLAAHAAVLLGAEQEAKPEGSLPMWLHDAVDASLREHLGFGYIEGVLVQRGPRSSGGYRLADESDRRRLPSAFAFFIFRGLDRLLPVLAHARVLRLMLEAEEGET